jgi:hypothetical protein
VRFANGLLNWNQGTTDPEIQHPALLGEQTVTSASSSRNNVKRAGLQVRRNRTFRDPAGNVIGLYQEPPKSAPGKASVAD